jgi:putative transposase
VKQVCDVLGVARSNVADKLARPADWQDGRTARKTDDASLVEEIRLFIADLPSYGYRRAWGLLRTERESLCAAPVNVKRVYRVMRDTAYCCSAERGRHALSDDMTARSR